MKYFAYGSNMSQKRMSQRKVDYQVLGKAILAGYKLSFNKQAKNKPGIGYANIVKQSDSFVEGILYEVNDLSQLDKFEGHPVHYLRTEVIVNLNNEEHLCTTYIAQPEYIVEGLHPEEEYLQHLLEGKEYLSNDYYISIINTANKLFENTKPLEGKVLDILKNTIEKSGKDKPTLNNRK
jgi:hypothetical protein